MNVPMVGSARVGSTPIVPAAMFKSRFARGVIRFMSRIANPGITHVAGTRWFSAFGLLVHRGRRSGRRFVSPVGVGGKGGGFLIPLTFGERSHWYLNVVAAGEGSIKWKGKERRVGHARVVAAADAKGAFSPALWLLLSLGGIRTYLGLEPID